MSTTDFDLDIPEFLKIPAEVRAASWVGRTLTIPASDPASIAEKRAAAEDEEERKKLIKRNRDITRRALEKEHKQFMSIPKSMRVWNTRYCRWEADPYLKAKAEREARAGTSNVIVVKQKETTPAKPKSAIKKLPVCDRVNKFIAAIRASDVGPIVSKMDDRDLSEKLELWRLTSPERAIAKAQRVYA